MNDDVPESVRAAWQAAVAAWDDPARHDAVIAQIAQHGCYAWGAARYRERAGDPIADRQLERVRKGATAAMFATAAARPDRGKSPYAATIALVIVLMLAVVGALIYASTRHAPPPPPTAPGR